MEIKEVAESCAEVAADPRVRGAEGRRVLVV